MDKPFIIDQEFKNNEYLEKANYENCHFLDCIIPSSNFSGYSFSECIFQQCDLSMSTIMDTSFKEVQFNNCKLLGLHFEDCSDFLLSFNFQSCILNFSSFLRLKIKQTEFVECKLEEVDFNETDLSHSLFVNCDLLRANFSGTILNYVDFRSSYNFTIDPSTNTLKQTKFSTQNVLGLLSMHDIIIE